MRKYKTGESASYGVYASTWPPDLCVVSADGDPLGGKDGADYRRIPLPLVIAAGPILGGIFVLTFPLLVVAAFVTIAVQVAYEKGRGLRDSQAHLVQLRWEPATSYLSHDDGEPDPDGDDEPTETSDDDELTELEDEVRAHRERERERERG